MEAFTLDTSGVVEGPIGTPDGQRYNAIGWAFLTPFQQGYVEALFAGGVSDEWFDHDEGRRKAITIYPAGFTFSDLAPETLAAILRDCERAAETYPDPAAMTAEAGRAFWAERQTRPHKAFIANRRGGYHVTNFPPLTPYLGDDGRVYLREGQ
jgi:hypothetical protein